jgi:hypothetical protein
MSILAGYLTEDEFIAELKERGIKRSKRRLQEMRQQRKGPAWTKFGKTVLYPGDGIVAYLKAQTQQPVRERRRVADTPRPATT